MKQWTAEAALVKAELRKEGRTRAWLVEQCGTVPGTMNAYLAGYRVPPIPVLKLMEQALPALTGKLLTQAKKETA